MLHKLFDWTKSWVLSPLLYGVGFAAWAFAPGHTPHLLFYCAAALLFLCAFVWSVIWVWTCSFFRRTSSKYGEHERRTARAREKENNYLWLTTAVLALLFLGADRKLFASYKLHSIKKQARVEVFLSGTARLKAKPVPFQDRPDRSIDMLFALTGVPSKNIVLGGEEKSVPIDIVVRNASGITIRNAHIKIDSNVAILGKTEGLNRLSVTELRGNVAEMRPSIGTSDEQIFSVQIPVPDYTTQAALLVTIEGENLKPFAAAGKVLFVKGSLPAPTTVHSAAIKAPR